MLKKKMEREFHDQEAAILTLSSYNFVFDLDT